MHIWRMSRATGLGAPESPPAASPPPDQSIPPAPVTPFWQVLLAAVVIVLAGLVAYSNSFHGGLVFDDFPVIKENTTIQNGWAAPLSRGNQPVDFLEKFYQRLPAPLQPPEDGQTVTGRPLVNLSFALNYDWATSHQRDGFATESYHRVNLIIHLLAGLALFGLVRRTLQLPKLQAQFSTAALPVAWMAALWWTVHPLQTESVAYLSQRAESLAGLFYLLTFYCFVRGTQTRPWLWMTLAALAGATAGLCKEIAITLPVMIFLFDWIFVSKKIVEPFWRRWPVYAGLLLAMLPLAWLVQRAGNRGNSAGFGLGVQWSDYAMAQFPAMVNYLKLAFWPHPLVIDYGDSYGLGALPLVTGNFVAMVVVIALVAGTLYLLWRQPMLGFLGGWFFVILAPSSSILPIVTEQAAEHRMYLPLAAPVVVAALGLWRVWQWRALPAALAVAVALGGLTFARNIDYRSGFNLWRSTVAAHPGIARTHVNFGMMLDENGRTRESIAEFLAAKQIKPNYPECDINLGNSFYKLGQNEEALKYFLRAVDQVKNLRDQAIANYDLGNALMSLRRYDEALKAYKFAGERAHDSKAYFYMGYIYVQQQNYDQAIASYLQALLYQPVYPECETTLGDAYFMTKQLDQAEQHYLHAIQEAPDFVDAHLHLGLFYSSAGKYVEATRELSTFVKLAPNSPDAHYLLGLSLIKLERPVDAAHEFEAALKINPNHEQARAALAEVQVAQPTGK